MCGGFFLMEEGWNLIICIKSGVCNFSTIGFTEFLFSGGTPTPIEPPLKEVGVNFSGMEEG